MTTMPYFEPGTARDAQAVTPSDSSNLASGTCAGLWVGGAGDVAIITELGTTVTVAGAVGPVPIRASRVLSTGTTATSILALY